MFGWRRGEGCPVTASPALQLGSVACARWLSVCRQHISARVSVARRAVFRPCDFWLRNRRKPQR